MLLKTVVNVSIFNGLVGKYMYNISFDTFQQDQTSNYNYKSETASIEHAVSPCRRSLRRLEDVKLHQTTRTCCQNYKKTTTTKKPTTTT